MASSVTPSVEGSSSTEPPLHGVLKTPGNFRRRTLPSPPSSILLSLDEGNFNTVTPNMENSYKMRPDISFNPDGARKLAEDILRRTFHGVRYEREKCRELVLKASEELNDSVKPLGSNRFKFVCMVYLGPLQSQGMCIASRCVMDERFDRCATASYRSPSLYAVATIYGIYRE